MIWDEIFGGSECWGFRADFLGPQSSQSPKLHDIFHEKKGVAATFWGVHDLLRLRFRIADSDVFSGLVDSLGDSIANWKR